MADPGLNELASVVAWWLAHPWRFVVLYLFTITVRALLLEIIASTSKAKG
jgi:hypothetical protein